MSDKECIYREDAIRAVTWEGIGELDRHTCDVLGAVSDNLRKLPAAPVRPVVLCRECKFSSADGGYDSFEQMKTHLNCKKWVTSGVHRVAVVPKDGFCFAGEQADMRQGEEATP